MATRQDDREKKYPTITNNEEKDERSLLEVFPNEVTRMLFEHFSHQQRISVSRVCSLWCFLVLSFPPPFPKFASFLYLGLRDTLSFHFHSLLMFNRKNRSYSLVRQLGERQGIELGLKSPTSVDVDAKTGNVIVAGASGHKLHVFDREDNLLFEIGSYGRSAGQLNWPYCVRVDPNNSNIVCVEHNNHRIQIFDSTGKSLRLFGSHGFLDGQFNSPFGLAVDQESNIYVSEMYGHRVQVFDANGNFKFKFGSHGSGDGQFESATGLAVDPETGNIAVGDYFNNRVQFFDPQGNFLFKIDKDDPALGDKFQGPMGLTNGPNRLLLVACNSSNTVWALTWKSGEIVCNFKLYQNTNAQGIGVDSNGNVFIPSMNTKKVLIFKPDF